MRRTLASIVVTGAILIACLGWANSRLAAEPISAADLPPAGASQVGAVKATGPTKEENEAVARFDQCDFDGAPKLLKEVAKKNPDSPPAQVLMARLFAQAGLPTGVRNALEQATVEAPTDPEAYIEMGDISCARAGSPVPSCCTKRPASCSGHSRRVRNARRFSIARTFSGLSLVQEARGDWAASQKQLERWLTYDRKSIAAMQRLARCLFQEKNAAGALQWLKEAAKGDPKLLTPEAILAEYYEQAGDRADARKWFVRGLESGAERPGHPRGREPLGLGHGPTRLGEDRGGCRRQDRPRLVGRHDAQRLDRLFQKDYPAAERYFQAAHIHWPHNFAASNHLALALVEQPDEAKKRQALDFAAINVQQSKDPEAAATYGWVLYKARPAR